MRGLLQHLVLTLKLNFRSMQPIVYGYLVPIFFLIAFGTLFRSGKPPLVSEIGQLITITILGGACFGMPTAMVSERERGVWRRYRLAPTATLAIIVSAMLARFVIILSAVILQLVLAWLIYGTTLPAHPIDMLIAFTFACFAFLGMGLVIAMLAETVPAVQALGQAIFLPMIIIGGVGVPLRNLSTWAQHVALFLPGRYAVEAIQACEDGQGLSQSRFALIALTGIGIAACIAGTKLFRWDIGQKIPRRGMRWVTVAVLAWAAVGLASEARGRLGRSSQAVSEILPSTTAPASTTKPITTAPSIESWDEITPAQIDAITFDELPDDRGTVVPVSDSLVTLNEVETQHLQTILAAVDKWPPAKAIDFGQRVRNVLNVAALYDLAADQYEAPLAYALFQRLQSQIPKDRLAQALTWVILKPNDGKVVTNLEELGLIYRGDEAEARERISMYARKLLLRVLNKQTQP